MALTRSFLEALGIEAPKIEEIIRGNADSISALQDKISALEKEAKKAADLQKELEGLKASGEKDPYKVKYDALKEEFANYKKTVETEAQNRAKTGALRSLLQEIGVSEKRLDAVIKVTSLDDITLDADGNIENAAAMKKNMAKEWADFIVNEEKHGVNPANPPANTGGTPKSRADIYKTDEHGRFLLDASQRQAEIAKLIAVEQQKG